tara:strand:- start:869 stop:2062 length:1194 start_codon:yes stop_codon:yes gene_type:complete
MPKDAVDDLSDFFSKKSKKKKKKKKKTNAMDILGDLEVAESEGTMESQLSVSEYKEKKEKELTHRSADTSWGREATYTPIGAGGLAMADMNQMKAQAQSAESTASERLDAEAAKQEFLDVQVRRAQRAREVAAAEEAADSGSAVAAPVERLGWRARSIAREGGKGASNVKPKLESTFDFPSLGAPSGRSRGGAAANPAASAAAASASKSAWSALQSQAEEKLDAQGYVIPFIPSAKWAGVKRGYYFGTKGKGTSVATGYYIDPLNPPTADGAAADGPTAAEVEEQEDLSRFAKKKKKKKKKKNLDEDEDEAAAGGAEAAGGDGDAEERFKAKKKKKKKKVRVVGSRPQVAVDVWGLFSLSLLALLSANLLTHQHRAFSFSSLSRKSTTTTKTSKSDG